MLSWLVIPTTAITASAFFAAAMASCEGALFTFAQINYFFLINEMIVPGSTYWNIAFGLQKGDVETDSECLNTIRNLAANMAWLMKKLAA